MKEKFRKYWFEIFSVCALWGVYVWYCSFILVELPAMTNFDLMPIIDKFYTGTLTFRDLLTTYGEHGMLGNNLMLLLNTIVFQMSTMFDIYVNDINVLIVAILVIVAMRRDIVGFCKESSIYEKFIYYLCFVLIALAAFNVCQQAAGGMDSQVKLGFLFCVISMYMTDRVLFANKGLGYVFATVVMIVFAVNVFGTLYSFATAPVVCLVVAVRCLNKKTLKSKEVAIPITWVVCCITYLFEYQMLGKGAMNPDSLTNTAGTLILNPIIWLEGLIGYSGSMLLGYGVLADHVITTDTYFLIGIVVFLVVLYAVYRFFANKQYTKSWLPMFLLGYSYFVWFLVSVGRFGDGSSSWVWFANDWYFSHTKIGLMAVIWILSHDIMQRHKKRKPKCYLASIPYIGLTCMFIFGCMGTTTQFERAPYVRAFYEARQPYLFITEESEMPVDENGQTPLFHNLETTMRSLEMLRKYNLSVYKYYAPYKQLQEINGPVRAVRGVHNDGWLAPEAVYNIDAENYTRLEIDCYYPEPITGSECITVFVNGSILMEYRVEESSFTLSIPLEQEGEHEIRLVCNFVVESNNDDVRELSVLTNRVERVR